MTTLLHWWITILADKTPAQAVLTIVAACVVLAIVVVIVRGLWDVLRYTPEPERRRPQDPRPPQPQPPRAAGSKPRKVA